MKEMDRKVRQELIVRGRNGLIEKLMVTGISGRNLKRIDEGSLEI